MADEVDYESDTAMAVEEEEEEKPQLKRSSSKRTVKGRGVGSAAMDVARYPGESARPLPGTTQPPCAPWKAGSCS
jgi:hypothetical protein